MQWLGILEFVAVVEQGSFTKAAQHLHLSTAQVSRQVSLLEQRLQSKLLYRTTRKVSLTEEGAIYYQHCRAVLDGLNEAERAISNLQVHPQGKIKITAPVTYGEQKILPLVNDFMVTYPEVTVSAYLSNRQVDLIEEGFDIAIRVGQLSDSSMMAKQLSQRTNYVCASPKYIAHCGTPYTLSELNQHRCLIGTRDEWRFHQQRIRINGDLRFNSGRGLLDAALKGLGIVQLPDYYVEPYLANGALVSVLDNLRIPHEGIWAVYPQNRHQSPKIKSLVAFLAKHLKDSGPIL